MNSKMVSMLVLQKGSIKFLWSISHLWIYHICFMTALGVRIQYQFFSLKISSLSYIKQLSLIHFAIKYLSVEYHLKAYHNYVHILAKRPVKIWVYLEKNSSWRKIYQWRVSPIRIGKILTLLKHWARITTIS